MVKNLRAMQETQGSISGSGGSPGEGHDNLLQYSCLNNVMDSRLQPIGLQRVRHD